MLVNPYTWLQLIRTIKLKQEISYFYLDISNLKNTFQM